MSQAEDAEARRLLVGAARAIASVRYCWLVTTADGGPVHARPMGQTPRALDEDEWTVRFVTDGRSRKASEIWRAGKVALIFQHEADDAYIALTGTATLRVGATKDALHWRDAYEIYFPGEEDRANAAFIEVRGERMELWIRGVTREPFGMRPTRLERGAAASWRLIEG
jgi:general stress protein 26